MERFSLSRSTPNQKSHDVVSELNLSEKLVRGSFVIFFSSAYITRGWRDLSKVVIPILVATNTQMQSNVSDVLCYAFIFLIILFLLSYMSGNTLWDQVFCNNSDDYSVEGVTKIGAFRIHNNIFRTLTNALIATIGNVILSLVVVGILNSNSSLHVQLSLLLALIIILIYFSTLFDALLSPYFPNIESPKPKKRTKRVKKN